MVKQLRLVPRNAHNALLFFSFLFYFSFLSILSLNHIVFSLSSSSPQQLASAWFLQAAERKEELTLCAMLVSPQSGDLAPSGIVVW